ncbi:molybdopterin molybdenumtransferase [Virgibacillus profundi]|uniref:Molybdopterin molybdenumtransferase n=1 Tax=Virgibacillus profundi TaxID=2024555 RepID=A0A2A2IBN9_9BACI|nr:gephyrin-like molybdotransferase Glp [Virgibacillus profundi]PAV28798.1 molybdopterin molybdenumtransferase [Virgibacillus profundi]PXY52966.1 molybdopterin molybdenumtransferase MoeA [Virgibacillus profundi]
MVERRKPIPINKAVEMVMNYRLKGQKEIISIHESDHRRLAEPIIAKNNVPSFDKSPYDGFALRSIDTDKASTNNPMEFEVVEHIGAGQVPTKTLGKGQATRIMTGAKIPDGADCIAMFEICKSYERNNNPFMSIKRKMNKDQNIIKEGSEVLEGKVLIEEGTIINPGVKALLATFGYNQVEVAKKPIVGIIATGTELLEVDEDLKPGKIRNSNAYMIASQINKAGGISKYYGKLADEFDTSYEAMKKALDEVDILITTGGVSVGDFDLMPAIYEKLKAEVLFNKVAMRPGSVTTVAVIEDKILFGLSGNPSACYVGFELFTRPIIQHYLYNKKPYLKRIKAILADGFPKPNPFTRFVRSYITYDNASVYVHLAGMDKSNVVTSLANSTCLMVLPGGTRGFKAGDEVEALLLDDMYGQSDF